MANEDRTKKKDYEYEPGVFHRGPVDHQLLSSYLDSPTEWFSRAYAQWVAVRSGHPQLLHELGSARTRTLDKFYPEFWDDEDFKEIASKFDTLFIRQGWIRKGSTDV